MFYSDIEDFEQNFKTLDRLNVLLFSMWKDKQADKYHDTRTQILEALYRNYISEMREMSAELALLQDQLNEQYKEIDELFSEMEKISQDPVIAHCWRCHAMGYRLEKRGEDYVKVSEDADFAARLDEMVNNEALISLAYMRTSIPHVEDVNTDPL